jgi:hypothetical protein
MQSNDKHIQETSFTNNQQKQQGMRKNKNKNNHLSL